MAEPHRHQGEAIDDVLVKAEESVIALRRMSLETRIDEVTHDLLAAEQAGDAIGMRELAAERLDLSKMMQELLRINPKT